MQARKRAIYISIRPEHTERIESGVKNYEFRKYRPQEDFSKLFIYETAPSSSMKYIANLGEIIEYPQKIAKEGYGNDDFNNGLKKSKFAYELLEVFKLREAITLKRLREEFGFIPPQMFSYDDMFPKLTEYLASVEKELIVGGNNGIQFESK